MAGDDRDDFGIGALGSHTNRVHGDRSRATRLQIDEPAMVGQPPISEKPRQHGKCLISERLVDKRFLPLQCLDSTPGWEGILLVESGVDQLGKQLCGCRQTHSDSIRR
jgi:hypothetical protein